MSVAQCDGRGSASPGADQRRPDARVQTQQSLKAAPRGAVSGPPMHTEMWYVGPNWRILTRVPLRKACVPFLGLQLMAKVHTPHPISQNLPSSFPAPGPHGLGSGPPALRLWDPVGTEEAGPACSP